MSNTWKNIKYGYVNINSSWKKIKNIYVNVNDTWKPLWNYSWYTGDWSYCSAECGGGTQTRTVYCKRSDNVQVDDSFCSGTKPSSQQSCNTQECADCKYSSNTFAWTEAYIRGNNEKKNVMISWNGQNVFWQTIDFNTTFVNSNGYKYIRGVYKEEPITGWYYYEVCRTPI